MKKVLISICFSVPFIVGAKTSLNHNDKTNGDYDVTSVQEEITKASDIENMFDETNNDNYEDKKSNKRRYKNKRRKSRHESSCKRGKCKSRQKHRKGYSDDKINKKGLTKRISDLESQMQEMQNQIDSIESKL